MKIRHAKQSDAFAVAGVLIDSWRETYQGIFPQSLLDNLDQATQTQRMLTAIQMSNMLVLENDAQQLIGFIGGGNTRQTAQFPFIDGELYALYVSLSAQGRGYGAKLVEAFETLMKELGYKGLLVKCLKENVNAQAFYQHMGFSTIGDQMLTLQESSVAETVLAKSINP